ncbi:MAG TPA: NADP-dependent oxidoreductase [Steroidobacteraceae bacterium]|nr:NADP-dependent oxidoreductase [Steroidobacteraceae bacterium]
MRHAFFAVALGALWLLSAGIASAADQPATMRAVVAHDYGEPATLRIEHVAVPRAGAGEVLVRVAASSVNPIDWKQIEGATRAWWPLEFPSIPGRDVAGVIAAVGDGVTGWQVGDPVMAYLGRATGAYAEYVAVPADIVARKPANLSFEESAGVPLVGLTAWQALIDAGALESGQTVLIHGGAGGVGSAAVQIASARGARVIATASSRNHEFLKQIGASQAIDYREVRFEDVVDDVDLVLDTVGGDTLERSVQVVRPGGRLVTIAGRAPDAKCEAAGIACVAILVEPNAAQLDELRSLIEAGRYRVHVAAVYPLEQVADALNQNKQGRTRGKIVLDIGRK